LKNERKRLKGRKVTNKEILEIKGEREKEV
jgi:hypothetical protein